MDDKKKHELNHLTVLIAGQQPWLRQAKYIQENMPLSIEEVIAHLAKRNLGYLPSVQLREAWWILTTHLPQEKNKRRRYIHKILDAMGMDDEQKRQYGRNLIRSEFTYFFGNDDPMKERLPSLKNINLIHNDMEWLSIWNDTCISIGTKDTAKIRESLQQLLEHFVTINDNWNSYHQKTALEMLYGSLVVGDQENETKTIIIDVLLDEGDTWRPNEQDKWLHQKVYDQITKHPRVIREKLEKNMVKKELKQITPKM